MCVRSTSRWSLIDRCQRKKKGGAPRGQISCWLGWRRGPMASERYEHHGGAEREHAEAGPREGESYRPADAWAKGPVCQRRPNRQTSAPSATRGSLMVAVSYLFHLGGIAGLPCCRREQSGSPSS
jgi:hypothetical protein